jgi:hypothetical protein
VSDASRSALEEPFSLEKLREAWQRQLVGHRDIPASVLKVALAIGWHLNRDKGGVAWPGIRRLSELTSLVPSTVSWAVKWLEKHQHLHVERRRNGKRNLPNLYRPLLRKRHERQTDVEQGVPITIEQGVPIATRVWTHNLIQ